MDIFLTKCMDSLQEAFIHPPEPCEGCFIMDGCALFDYFWTVEQKHPPSAIIKLGRARTIFNITPIGFVKSGQVTFIYIALLTIQIVSKQLHNIKIEK